MRGKILLIMVFAVVVFLVPTIVQAYTIKPDHPRIWLTAELLTTLKQKAANNTPQWQRLKLYTDAVGTGNVEFLPAHALIYKVSGDTTYRDKAIQVMRSLDAQGLSAISGDWGYNSRFIVPWFSVAYDWLYDDLSAEDKANFTAQIIEWNDWVLAKFLNREWGTDPSTNYMYGHWGALMSGGLAIYGEDPKAQTYLDFALNDIYTTRVKPYFQSVVKDGGWPEGYGYGAGVMNYGMTESLEGFRTATGENLFQDDNNLRDVIEFTIRITLPTASGYMMHQGQGDWASGFGGYHRGYMLVLAQRYINEDIGQYGQYWLNHVMPDITSARNYVWKDFLWTESSQPEKPFDSLSLDEVASGIGFLTSRTSWQNNATWLGFQAGPYQADHQHRDEGTFSIYKNGYLVYEGGGMLGATSNHNTFIINETGQTSRPEGSAKITNYENNANYSFVKADLALAYRWEAGYKGRPDTPDLLEKYDRQLIFLKPNYVVIFDHIKTTNLTYTQKWLMHTKNEPTVTAGGSEYSNGNAKLFHKALLPSLPVVSKVFEENRVNFTPDDQWRIEVSPSNLQQENYYLNVLQVANNTTTQMVTTTKLDSTDGAMTGAQVGDYIVMFSKNATISSTSYTVSGTGTAKHLITGLKPNAYFNIKDNGNQVYTNLKSSGNGTLNFTTNLGSVHDIFIFEATLASCSSQGGFVCTDLQTCGGTWLPANDTSRCCSVACTSDTTPPTISNVRNSTVTNSSATILWTTNESSTSVVYYGTTASLGLMKSDASLVAFHNIQLTSLSPSTLYYYKTGSCDASGNCANSTLQNFTTTVITQTCSDGTAYGQCSSTKSLYCQNGTLVNACTTCGCLSGQQCNATSQACYTPACIPATEICGNGIDEDCNGADLQCSACSQGLIPSTGCSCGGANYYSGYCCNNVYSSTPCPTGNYTKLTVKGRVRSNTATREPCYPNCKITITFIDSANATNTASGFNYTSSDGNFTLTLIPSAKFGSGYHALKILIEKNMTKTSVQRRVYVR